VLPGDHRQTLAELVTADTQVARAALVQRLDNELARLLDRSADAAQVAVWQMERRLSAQLQQQFGVTNEMIGDAVMGARAAQHGIGGLQKQLTLLEGTFSEVGETLSGHTAQLDEHAGRIDLIEQDIAAFRESRDASIRERREHAAQLQESTDDRLRMTQQYTDLSAQLQEIHRQLTEVLARLPPADDAAEAGG